MLKRIWLFLITNIAILVVLNIVIFVCERFFWISISWQWSYTSILIFSAIIWFTWSFISLFISKWIAKRVHKIKILTKAEANNLGWKEWYIFSIIEDLAERNNIKTPEFWIYASNEPNAFATWPSKNNSLVAISSGLLNSMDKDEIKWVIGHEMSHIISWDMVTMTLMQWVLNTFVVFFSRIIANLIDSFLEEWLSTIAYFVINIALQIVFWMLASIVIMKFSRYREFEADKWSANFIWKENMIKALEALKNMKNITIEDKTTLATMKINNKSWSGFKKLFSSHPNLDERIKRLKELNI